MAEKKKSKSKDASVKTAGSGDLERSLPDLVREDPEIIENLKHLKPDEMRMLSVILKRSTSYSGPLPPAEQFQMYEGACSGAGARILDWADKEQAFRHEREIKVSDAMIRETDKGQNMGFAIMVCLIVAALICALIGQVVVASIFAAAPAFDIVRKFIDGRDHKKN